jgi:uncharacterized protein YcbK (DUF882 family)
LTRRCFVKYALQLAAGIVLATPFEGLASLSKQPMSFYHTHTGEHLQISYSYAGLKPSTLKKLNNFFRDFRTGDIHPIDPALLNILYNIQRESGSRGVIEIISAYRSPETNERLRSKSRSVALRSLHMKGQALDIRLSDLETRDLRDVAISLGQGGVGYYAKSDFVHIDTGDFRTW